jgi:hypothetical protein
MKYRLTINGADHFPESAEQLKNLLDFARGHVCADLSLRQIDRKPKLLTWLIAWIKMWDLSLLNQGGDLSALINGDLAIVFFCHDMSRFAEQPDKERPDIDIEGLLFCSVNPAYGPDHGQEEVEFIVDGSRYPERKCVATDKVSNAFLSFYQTGVRPDCIDWESMSWDDIIDSEM